MKTCFMWVSALVFLAQPAQAAVSNIVLIRGTVTGFDSQKVRLTVAKAALVVPRKRVLGSADDIRENANVNVELPIEEIRYDSAVRPGRTRKS